MVVVLMKNEGCNLQAAVDIVGEMCKGSIDCFKFESTQLPSWGATVDKAHCIGPLKLKDILAGKVAELKRQK